MTRFVGFGIAVALAVLSAVPASAMPDFIPSPGGIYEDYTALVEPRTELPLGALWVQGYGPAGEGAAAENVATVKSLTGVAINRDTQLNLFSGILNLFGIDPSYKSRLSVRLSDVAIVRVKDMAKLSGPTGEPRLYEALRAGTITISIESDVGLDGDPRATGKKLPIIGRADTGHRRSFSIDGRDMFIAYRVATLKSTRSDEEELSLRWRAGGADAEFGRHAIGLDTSQVEACICGAEGDEQAASCQKERPVMISVTKLERAETAAKSGPEATQEAALDQPAELKLALPVSDGKGGLYSAVVVSAALDRPRKTQGKAPTCDITWGRKSRVTARLQGSRLETLPRPQGTSW